MLRNWNHMYQFMIRIISVNDTYHRCIVGYILEMPRQQRQSRAETNLCNPFLFDICIYKTVYKMNGDVWNRCISYPYSGIVSPVIMISFHYVSDVTRSGSNLTDADNAVDESLGFSIHTIQRMPFHDHTASELRPKIYDTQLFTRG